MAWSLVPASPAAVVEAVAVPSPPPRTLLRFVPLTPQTCSSSEAAPPQPQETSLKSLVPLSLTATHVFSPHPVPHSLLSTISPWVALLPQLSKEEPPAPQPSKDFSQYSAPTVPPRFHTHLKQPISTSLAQEPLQRLQTASVSLLAVSRCQTEHASAQEVVASHQLVQQDNCKQVPPSPL